MSIFIATGSNIGDPIANLLFAKKKLQEHLSLIAESRVYLSPPVDFLDQPDFHNQVLEFSSVGAARPLDLLQILLKIEIEMGRKRKIPKGPRLIDIDILFYDFLEIQSLDLEIPHPRLFNRSFVVLPLRELPGFEDLSLRFNFPTTFPSTAVPLTTNI